MRRSTKHDERGELPRCSSCERPLTEDALRELGPQGEPLAFCDARCREDYFEKADRFAERDPGSEGEAA